MIATCLCLLKPYFSTDADLKFDKFVDLGVDSHTSLSCAGYVSHYQHLAVGTTMTFLNVYRHINDNVLDNLY